MNNRHDGISEDVAEKLGIYVYRLIDPRNGETFYVGKGQGSRVLQHANNEREIFKASTDENTEDAVDLKRRRISDIKSQSLSVIHVIHRHNIESDSVAHQIEAALIDAYPGLSNKIGGHKSGDFGCRHLSQIIDEYSRPEFSAMEPLILISVSRSLEDENTELFDAVRGCWKISKEKALGYKLVLGHRRGIVLGAFRPSRWLDATPENFKWLASAEAGRIGFEGDEADQATRELYVQKRVPNKLRRKGAANPVRYVDP